MAQTIMVPAKTFEEILSRLDKLTRDVSAIKARLFEQEPLYGSKEWWEWSDKKALEEIKAGKGIKFDSAEEAIKWLNS
ncbi:MAG: Uncharacterized protein CEO21_229 [Microgenomates group bacterium Gr01-1014_80]|nr:MAG: Uncharacterized protein CEO21_229 [Microgenomates group bacterium Gr01-1014_80]